MRYPLLPLLLLGTLITTAQAAVYKCPTATGGIAFQDLPCSTAGGAQLSLPTGPPTTYVPPLPSAPPPPAEATAPADQPPDVPVAPAAAAPGPVAVSTSQLSLIKVGMTMSEVETRLGPPASVRQIGNAFVAREEWTYPGAGGVKTAVVIFESGRVTSRGREGSEYKRSVGDLIHRQ